jgi:phosphotransferase system  glucose/maltose/N-acetylglucosamine-specific IIC component
MKEFWLWVAVVTLLLFIAMILSFGVVYNHKQIKTAEALLQRLEEKERKSAKPRVDPKPDSPDGL